MLAHPDFNPDTDKLDGYGRARFLKVCAMARLGWVLALVWICLPVSAAAQNCFSENQSCIASCQRTAQDQANRLTACRSDDRECITVSNRKISEINRARDACNRKCGDRAARCELTKARVLFEERQRQEAAEREQRRQEREWQEAEQRREREAQERRVLAMPAAPPSVEMAEQATSIPGTSSATADVSRVNSGTAGFDSGLAMIYHDAYVGLPTANGEVFSQDSMTAAHGSFPLPSLISVTNTSNGRAVVLRVNDRGPFKDGYVLEVSKRAADALGFGSDTQAPVTVQWLGSAGVAVPEEYYVQLASYSDIDNVVSLVERIGDQMSVQVFEVRVNGGQYYRIRSGPFPNREEAERVRDTLAAQGIANGRVVLAEE